MAADEIGPVPAGAVAGAPESELPSTLEWFNEQIRIIQRDATTTDRGRVLQAAEQADSTATTVSDLKDDFNALLAKMKAAGQMDD